MAVDGREQLLILSDFNAEVLAGLASNDARGPALSAKTAGIGRVTTAHEQDTVQSYFNFARLEELLAGHFALEECRLIRNESVISPGFHSRYHVVAKPR
jgi:hypothetical protein